MKPKRISVKLSWSKDGHLIMVPSRYVRMKIEDYLWRTQKIRSDGTIVIKDPERIEKILTHLPTWRKKVLEERPRGCVRQLIDREDWILLAGLEGI